MFFKKKEIPSEEQINKATSALQNGGAEAFHILYHSYANKVYRFCLRMLGDQEQAEDAFQETFMRVYESRETFHGNNFAAWLFVIARNTCYNYIRSRKEQIPFEETYHAGVAKPDNIEVGIKPQIDKAIASLPLPLREAFILREYEDFSYQQIADSLGVELSLVKVRIHRARILLRKMLKPLVKELNES